MTGRNTNVPNRRRPRPPVVLSTQEARRRLEAAGCDHEALRARVEMWHELRNRGSARRAHLDRLIRDAKDLANRVQTFNAVLPVFAAGEADPRLRALPDSLRAYVEMLAELRPSLDGRRHRWFNILLANVVAYVISATGRPHDQDIADLLNGDTAASCLSAEAVRMWRNRRENAELVEALSARITLATAGTHALPARSDT